MFLIHGVYRFWPKKVAFRNDFCLSCEAPRRSIAVRTFDVGHVYWSRLCQWVSGSTGRAPFVAATRMRTLRRGDLSNGSA